MVEQTPNAAYIDLYLDTDGAKCVDSKTGGGARAIEVEKSDTDSEGYAVAPLKSYAKVDREKEDTLISDACRPSPYKAATIPLSRRYGESFLDDPSSIGGHMASHCLQDLRMSDMRSQISIPRHGAPGIFNLYKYPGEAKSLISPGNGDPPDAHFAPTGQIQLRKRHMGNSQTELQGNQSNSKSLLLTRTRGAFQTQVRLL